MSRFAFCSQNAPNRVRGPGVDHRAAGINRFQQRLGFPANHGL